MTTVETLREYERRRYHAECLVRCLEAKLERVEPFSVDYDLLMHQLDQAADEVHAAALALVSAKLETCETTGCNFGELPL